MKKLLILTTAIACIYTLPLQAQDKSDYQKLYVRLSMICTKPILKGKDDLNGYQKVKILLDTFHNTKDSAYGPTCYPIGTYGGFSQAIQSDSIRIYSFDWKCKINSKEDHQNPEPFDLNFDETDETIANLKHLCGDKLLSSGVETPL